MIGYKISNSGSHIFASGALFLPSYLKYPKIMGQESFFGAI